jgi:pyrroloquinoline quinone biosynthesis protein D
MQFITATRRGGLRTPVRAKFRRTGHRRSVLNMDATTISDLARPSVASGVRLQIDSTTGKNVLLYPEGIVELNETAQEILSRCDGRTVCEIVQALAEEYDADRAAIAADVHETLASLHRRKLIEFT